ncbi:discoidin domain-containing protein [Phycicoccus sp. CSK15P-2]|uniref:discoidin domain-containing protein n=1 Tax=Phycicoccus sp. CSK15P-2 TaxID=2807627 RepID=UPI00194DC1A7|nr:discoidin domain-containing protein [Phycicoccus sp. CSK15P-2]MBM6404529.1 discoidin domain-containing protein [Phycicoccus sp. CSK15P-2]
MVHPLRLGTLPAVLTTLGVAGAVLSAPAAALGSAAAGCSAENAALGRPAQASSSENPDYYPASSAVDGDASTRWSSAATDDEWLRVDLGAVTDICGVEIDWERAYGSAYEVQVSDDAQEWATLEAVTDGDGGTDTLAVDGRGRYVRLLGTTRATGYGYSVWELAVHTDEDAAEPPTDPEDPDDPTDPYPDYVNPGWPGTTGPLTEPSHVEVVRHGQGWRLEVDGQPYTVRGLTWGPSPDEADEYMPGLAEMNANTTRTWGTGPDTAALLDSAAAHGIRVVMGFWLVPGGGPGSGGCVSYQGDTEYEADTRAHILEMVERYQSHPGVLMWSVGNESILGLQNCYSGAELEAERTAYTQFVNDMAVAIHDIDPDHPVSSTDAWTGAWDYYAKNSPDLDLLQVNSYGGVCDVADTWEEGGYDKPYLVTEGGAAGEWEVPDDVNGVPDEPTDVEKAAAYVDSWRCIMEHEDVGLGATFFHYGTEGDFGGVWFNVVPGGNKRLGYYALAKTWGRDIGAMNTPPQFRDLTVEGDVTAVEAGSTVRLTADVVEPDGDPLTYVVSLNSKYVDGAGGLAHQDAAQPEPGVLEITAPERPGVWKVYVWAEDGEGNVGVETRSFRVTPPGVEGTNAALGKPATASSFDPWNGDFSPKQAVDGDLATRWASDWDDDEWIQVDLGSTTSFDHVQLVWEAAYGTAYDVQVSDDGSTWSTVRAVTDGDGGVDDLDVTASGRYVRLALHARGTQYGYSLYELGVYTS